MRCYENVHCILKYINEFGALVLKRRNREIFRLLSDQHFLPSISCRRQWVQSQFHLLVLRNYKFYKKHEIFLQKMCDLYLISWRPHFITPYELVWELFRDLINFFRVSRCEIYGKMLINLFYLPTQKAFCVFSVFSYLIFQNLVLYSCIYNICTYNLHLCNVVFNECL